MGKVKTIITVLAMTVFVTDLYADVIRVTDNRYCGEPKRNAAGRIVRSKAVRDAFEALYPLPSVYSRSAWHVDHVIPLAVGGCDAVNNMQWLPIAVKTCAENYCKDRFERIIYKTR